MLKLYNTLTKQKEIFKPIKKRNIGMYVCGPTVYGPSHLGHGRTYVAFDIVRRYLEYLKYKVKYIINITDIHDDIIKKAVEENSDIFSLASKYIPQFHSDLAKLNVKRATVNPRVTEHIRQIIDLIKNLEKNGYAYKNDNSIYFDVSKFKNYGKLSGIKINKEKTATRVQTDKYERESPSDFVLWKETKPGEPYWQSPWGAGRPGWHIECSAMSMEYLGESFEIHGGGGDLTFPHHENEIAQSEGATGKKPFAKYWLHTGTLTVNGVKMSRSLGNYIEIPDALKKYNPLILRFFIISSHYRSPLDFNETTIKQAEASLDRIREFIDKLNNLKKRKNKITKKQKNEESAEIKKLIDRTKKKFIETMNDDFNTPLALASLFNLIKKINKLFDNNKISANDAKNLIKFIKEINSILNIVDENYFKIEKIPDEIKKLAETRKKFRNQKEWHKADESRKKMEILGYSIEDTKFGPIIKKL